MTHILYNEMYVYVWFICIYHVILVILVLTNLVLLVKIYCHKPPQFPLSLFSTSPSQQMNQPLFANPSADIDISQWRDTLLKLAQLNTPLSV